MTYDIENFGITHIEDRKGGEVIYEEKIGSEAYNNKILASAQKYGDEAVAIAKKDIEKMTSWHARTSFPKEQLFNIIEPWFMNMTIVRLNLQTCNSKISLFVDIMGQTFKYRTQIRSHL